MKSILYYLCIIAFLSFTACNGNKKLVSEPSTPVDPEPAMDVMHHETSSIITIVIEEINYLFPTLVNGREEMVKHKVMGIKTERMSGSKTLVDVVVEGTNQSFTAEKKEVAGTEQLVWIGGDPPANPR